MQGGGEERGGADEEPVSVETRLVDSILGSTEKLHKARPKISALQNANMIDH